MYRPVGLGARSLAVRDFRRVIRIGSDIIAGLDVSTRCQSSQQWPSQATGTDLSCILACTTTVSEIVSSVLRTMSLQVRVLTGGAYANDRCSRDAHHTWFLLCGPIDAVECTEQLGCCKTQCDSRPRRSGPIARSKIGLIQS